MSPSITYMAQRDFRSFCTLFESIVAEGRYFVRPYAPSRRDLKHLAQDAVRRSLPFYVAVKDRLVTGFAAILFPTLPSLAHSGTVVMGVLPRYRRQGLGASLLDRAISHAFQNPTHTRVQLEVFQDNEAAVALYTKLGFQIEGVAKRAVFLDNEYKNVVNMALVLGEDQSSEMRSAAALFPGSCATSAAACTPGRRG